MSKLIVSYCLLVRFNCAVLINSTLNSSSRLRLRMDLISMYFSKWENWTDNLCSFTWGFIYLISYILYFNMLCLKFDMLYLILYIYIYCMWSFMYDIVCDKFYVQPYWRTIGSMKWNVLQLQLQLINRFWILLELLDLRLPWRWIRRVLSTGLQCCVAQWTLMRLLSVTSQKIVDLHSFKIFCSILNNGIMCEILSEKVFFFFVLFIIVVEKIYFYFLSSEITH
jgi:hypothetical protein